MRTQVLRATRGWLGRAPGVLPIAAALFSLVLLLRFVAACGTTPAVTVVRTSAGTKQDEIKGDPLKLKRHNQESFTGLRGGFYVVRNPEDWKLAWPSGKTPPLPEGLDTSSHMLFVAAGESQSITQIKVQRALETAEMLFVWVRETKVGEGCVNKSNERAVDGVVTTRVDKPVKFLVDTERGESCGAPPQAKVECRLKNAEAWTPAVIAQPGDTVECELNAQATGKFELVDRVLAIELPAGSSAKLAFAKGPLRGELGIDVYGTYTVTGEAADEAGRRGRGTATIDVKPPKTKDVLVQLVWAGFELKDESDTFPRVNLRVAEEGPRGQRCSAEIPIPGLCEVKTRGAYTYMRIPEGSRKLPVSVQFLDDRPEKGPGPCVHVWFDGVRTGETCDRKHREQDEIWRVGTLDTTTGRLSGDGAPAPPMTPADAGVADAAVKKPEPKKPAPKK
jgi:hypothetical protein